MSAPGGADGAMDASGPDEEERRARTAPPRPPRTPERARAAAYLDLWERHVGQAAIQAPGPVVPRPKG